MSLTGAVPPPRPAPSGLGYTLAGTAVILTLAALVIAYLFSAWVQVEAAANAEPVVAGTVLKTIGGQRYTLPMEMLSVPSQRVPGFADRIDLTLPIVVGGADATVSLSIVPRGRATVSARLLDSVYVHQFAEGEVPGVRGLVGKPLEGSAAYRNETVWYDPLSISPFVAKCTSPVEGAEAGEDCLRVAPLSDNNLAILTFSEDLLPHWREVDAAVDTALASLRR